MHWLPSIQSVFTLGFHCFYEISSLYLFVRISPQSLLDTLFKIKYLGCKEEITPIITTSFKKSSSTPILLPSPRRGQVKGTSKRQWGRYNWYTQILSSTTVTVSQVAFNLQKLRVLLWLSLSWKVEEDYTSVLKAILLLLCFPHCCLLQRSGFCCTGRFESSM